MTKNVGSVLEVNETGKLYQCKIIDRKVLLPEYSLYLLTSSQSIHVSFITQNLDDGLSIYPESSWDNIKSLLAYSPSASSKYRQLQRITLGLSQKVNLIDGKAIEVPFNLLQLINTEVIDSDLFVLVLPRKIEVWDPVLFYKHVSYEFINNEFKIIFRVNNSYKEGGKTFGNVLLPAVNLE